MRNRPIQFRGARRRGAIFVLALAVIVILSGLVLVFAQEMRTEALASANRLAYVQADSIEQGAEQWVLAQVESYAPDAVTITETEAEALPVGGGYFWVLHPDPTQDQTYGFGITDEAGKLNLNNATATTPLQFINLPGMTSDIVTAIDDWITPGGGSTADYYQSLQEPYNSKGGKFESVPELMLMKEMTPQILYGNDLNHDGVIDENEKALAGVGAQFNTGTTDTRGLFNYVTCFSLLPAAPAGGTAPTSVSSAAFENLLRTSLPSVAAKLTPGQTFTSLSAFIRAASGISPSDYGKIAGQVTSNVAANQLLNVNTASEQALMCLPTLAQADADAIIAARTNADFSDMSWFFNAVPSKMGAVADWVTDQSYQYSADIVAVSGDGRAFKRVLIVVDASNYPTTPARIVYRKDLTSLGWPLSPEDRASLRAGEGVTSSTQTLGLGSNGPGMQNGMTNK
jgi:type II secretory pathway component PulK